MCCHRERLEYCENRLTLGDWQEYSVLFGRSNPFIRLYLLSTIDISSQVGLPLLISLLTMSCHVTRIQNVHQHETCRAQSQSVSLPVR